MEAVPVDNDDNLTALESGDFQTALPLLPKDGPPITIGPEGGLPLHYACRHGDTRALRCLATQYKNSIYSSNKHGQTPAHLAAQYGHIEVLKVLVELFRNSGLSTNSQAVKTSSENGTLQGNTQTRITASQGQAIDMCQYFTLICKDHNGGSPLHLAAQNGHLHVVKYLVDEVGCLTSPTDERGRSPLYLAAGSGHLEVVRYFTHEKKCDPNMGTTKWWKPANFNISPGRTPLHAVSERGHLHIVCFLVNVLKCKPFCTDSNGVTPLTLAASNGHLPIVQFLVESGCDSMVTDVDGRTPLHYASQNGHIDTVRYFASTDKVNLPCQDKNGVTPLLLAAEFGHVSIVQFLVESGCDPMIRMVNGRAPIHQASQSGHLDTVKFFHGYDKIDLSCQDKKGVTPLTLAASNGHLPIVQFLVESGCDSMVTDVDCRTPLHYASQNGHIDTVRYFASTDKVNLPCQDKNGVTPLLLAAEFGHVSIVQFLVESGCDPMIRMVNGRAPIHQASQSGHLDTVKFFHSCDKIDLSCQDKKGVTPLNLAAHCGCLKVVKFLVESGCDPMVRMVNGRAPIHQASQNGHLDTVRYLAGTGHVDLSCQDKCGATPLLLAAATGHLPVVRFLVESGCDPMVRVVTGRTSLHLASQSGHLDTVMYLANTVDQENLLFQDTNGHTPFSLAASNGHLSVVLFLVELGCDPGIMSKVDSRTPLHYASQNGHLDTVKYISSINQVDLSCQDKHGFTPASLAASNGHLPVLQFLVELGCDRGIRQDIGRTLQYASQNGHLDIVMYLASIDGVNLSCQGDGGVTPLHLATKGGHLPVVKFLIESGCDPMIKNVNSKTPLHQASENGHLDMVKYFSTISQVDLSCRDKNGVTPIHLAAKSGYVPVIQFLVESGCDPMVRNLNGQTPLHVASQNGHLDTIKYFATTDGVDLSCQDKNGITPVSIAANLDQWDVALYLHSKGEPIPSHISDALRPLSPLIKAYVVGNQSSGKSSLVKALTAEGSWFGRFLNIEGVTLETAGVLPSEFDSKAYGRVIFYDFAGHPEYYSGHEAVFENASQPVIVVVVDLSKDNHSITRALRYWRLLLHSSISATGSQAHVVIVGSHGDLVRSRDLSSKTALLELFTCSSVLSVVGNCVLDCRKSASKGMSTLHSLLKKSCRVVRVQSDFDYENGRILNNYLTFSLSTITALTFSELRTRILGSAIPALQPLKSPDLLYHTCESLSISGHLLFLRNKSNLEESWLVLKKEVILSQVNGLLKYLKKNASLGIVSLSLLTRALEEHVRGLSPDLAMSYMTTMLFCSQVDSQALKQLTGYDAPTCTESEQEVYFFFPSLVIVEKPAQVWSPTDAYYDYACIWQLKCTDPNSFFTPRFLQTLQLMMASKFALKVCSFPPGLLEPEKGCRLWLNGIRWISDGIEVVMHVANDNTMLSLMLRCVKDQEMACVKLRSKLIKQVFTVKRLILNMIQTSEYLVHPYFLQKVSIPEAALIPLNEIAAAIVQIASRIYLDDSALEHVPEYPYLLVQKLLFFEPFEGIGVQILQDLLDQENSSEIVKPSILHKLAGALNKKWKPIATVLRTPPDVLAGVDAKNTSDFDKCLIILKEWAHREGTYSALCRDLGQYSIFCGRNPLDTSGITITSVPGITDSNPPDIDNLSEEKRRLLQGTPTLRQLLCVYPNGDRSQREVRTLAVVAPKWEVVAFCLEFEEHIVQTIARNNTGDCEGACRDMFGRWLDGNYRHPVTWETLIRALYEADESLKSLGDQLVDILCCTSTQSQEMLPKSHVQQVDVSVHGMDHDILPDDLPQDSPTVDVSVHTEVEDNENVQ